MKSRVPYVRSGETRRGFSKKAGLATGAAMGFPYFVPAKALGADGHVAASERLVMGCIGVGSQGTSNMQQFLELKDIQIVAVCDVDASGRAAAQEIINSTYDNKYSAYCRCCWTPPLRMMRGTSYTQCRIKTWTTC